jgi:hypothetical protein
MYTGIAALGAIFTIMGITMAISSISAVIMSHVTGHGMYDIDGGTFLICGAVTLVGIVMMITSLKNDNDRSGSE